MPDEQLRLVVSDRCRWPNSYVLRYDVTNHDTLKLHLD